MKRTTDNKVWFYSIILFLIIDYGRPQDILPIGSLHLGLIMNAILAVFLIRNGNVCQLQVRQVRMIWLFVGLLSIYIPFAENNFFAYTTTKFMLLFMPFILSVTICVDSIDRLRKVMLIVVLVMIYVSVYGFMFSGMGSGSYFNDENDLSLFVNMWLPFCFFLFSAEKEKLRKATYAFGLFTGLVANVKSLSRGGFVGMICVAFICWLFSKKKIISLIVICIAGLAIYFAAGDLYLREMGTVTDVQEGTAQARLKSWEAGWHMFLDNPWGVGGNNFQVLFPYYQPDWFQRGMWGRVSHSLWFTLLPEVGVIGVLIYFLLLYYNLKDIFFLRQTSTGDPSDLKFLRALSNSFLASMVGYFASGTFLSVLYYPHYWYLTGLIVAATGIAKRLPPIQRPAAKVGATRSIQ